MHVRGVRVIFLVGVLVVLAVGGAPFEDGAFDGHGAEGGEGVADDRAGDEGLVGEEAVVADGDAHGGGVAHAEEDAELDPVEGLAPGEDHGRGEADEGDDDRADVDHAQTAFNGGEGNRDGLEFAGGVFEGVVRVFRGRSSTWIGPAGSSATTPGTGRWTNETEVTRCICWANS